MTRWWLVLTMNVIMLIVAPAITWSYWAAFYGILWGTVMWFIFFSAGIWLNHLWHRKQWP